MVASRTVTLVICAIGHVSFAFREPDTTPSAPNIEEVADCGGVRITNVGSVLGCGADGCAWKVTTGDGKTAILKMARESEAAQKLAKKECNFAKALQKAGVERALQCLGSCTSGGSAASVMFPFVPGTLEFGPNMIRLGDSNEHAVVEMIKTSFQMLHSGFVNGDQANNVLYYPESGDPLFIDFGRAIRVTKSRSGFNQIRLDVQVKNMLWDLIAVTVPPELCGVAKRTVHEEMEKLPPSEFLASSVAKVLDLLEKKWETCAAA